MSAETICIEHIEKAINAYRKGEFNTMHIDCECGKSEHRQDAKYCTSCGRKLEKAAGSNTDDSAIVEILSRIKSDPAKIKAFVVDVLGEEWETRHFDE